MTGRAKSGRRLVPPRRSRRRASCVGCGKVGCGEPNSFAWLSTGALWMSADRKSGIPHERMHGFLTIGWHGAHDGGQGPNSNAWRTVEMVAKAPMGQAELLFCSPACMRTWLVSAVDQLERQVLKPKRASRRSSP